MLGRILGWFLYQNACTSSAYAKLGWALKISEIVHLKFVAWILFLRLSLGSLNCPDQVGAKQGGLVWKRRYPRVSISYLSRVKAIYHFLLK